MFERFTDRARRAIKLSREEADLLNHNYVGTEHLLLGLIREGEGVAAQVLESLDISLDAVREQVLDIIGQGLCQQSWAGHIPFSLRAKKVLELSLREGLQLGHNYVDTEHLLLGLIREGEGVAAQVLVKLGADLNRLRSRTLELLGKAGTEVPRPRPRANILPPMRLDLPGGPHVAVGGLSPDPSVAKQQLFDLADCIGKSAARLPLS